MEPHPPAPLIGREIPLAEVRARLTSPGVTLLHGPAGVGKTRLAHEIVRLDDRACFVDLTHTRTRQEVLSAVSGELHTPAPRSDSDAAVTAIRRALTARGAVLVLDNAEQVAGELAPLAAAWGTAVPVLVTSQVVLQADAVLRLDPLGAADALTLFEVRSGRDWPAEQRHAAATLVERVGGLPLAVVLAAARSQVLAPTQLLARMDDPLRWLSTGDPGRHGALDRALAGAWELLDDDARSALAQASVFRGPFTLELAERVLRIDGEVADTLAALAERSLLEREVLRSGAIAWHTLPTVRAFAELHRPAEVDLRHAEAFVRDAVPRLTPGAFSLAERNLVTRERYDLLAIIERFSDERPDLAARAVLRLGPWLLEHGGPSRHAELLEMVLPAAPPELRGVLLLARANVHKAQARIEDALADGDGALALARELGDEALEAAALTTRGTMLHDLHDPATAERCYLQARDAARRSGAAEVEGAILHGLALYAVERGVHAEADALIAQCLRARRRQDDRVGEAGVLRIRARLRRRQNRLVEALDDTERAVMLSRLESRNLPTALTHLALMQSRLGRWADARINVLEALDLSRRTGHLYEEAHALSLAMFVSQGLGELERARDLGYEALALAEEHGLEQVEVQAHSDLVSTLLELGDADGAEFHVAPAVAGWVHPSPRAVMLAWGAAVAWTRRDHDTGEARMAAARELAQDPGAGVELAPILRVLEAFREAMLARVARDAGDLPQAAKHRADAEGAAALGRSGDDVGGTAGPDAVIAARCLERQLADLLPALEVAPGGEWFRAPGGDLVDLSSRAAARRILAALAAARVAEPGRALALEALLAAGWPGERVTIATAGSRVHVALSTLRKLGLKDWIVNTPEGWALDPERPVIRRLTDPS